MRQLPAFVIALALMVLSTGVAALGQPPAGVTFDFADDLARIRGESPTIGDLLGDLSGVDRQPVSDAPPLDPAALAGEFDASIGTIRSQQAELDAQEVARVRREAEAARLAAVRAEEARLAELAAAQLQSLHDSCDRSYDRCESRCSGASNGAILGAFADALAGNQPQTQLPSYSSCANQCRSERTQCRSAADDGQGYRPTFSGPTGSGSTSSGAQSYNPGGDVNSPQCKAAEAEARRAMSGLGQGAGICQSARDSIKMYQAGLRYLQLCPSADPTGGQRRQHEAAIAQSRDVERSSCN